MVIGTWPNFLIVGAAKSGTTSLYKYLGQHPEIFVSATKEPHFFSRIHPEQDQKLLHKAPITREQDYLRLFSGVETEKAIGEASTSYLWDRQAPLRIREKIPEVKILILLRDPIERAFSHYLMDVREGIQGKPFYDALVQDFYRDDKGWHVSHLYVELGQYFDQVRRYLEVFGQDQVSVFMFEDLKGDPFSLLCKVASFLDVGVEPFRQMNLDNIYNPYAVPRNSLVQRILGTPLVRYAWVNTIPRKVRQRIRHTALLKESEKPSMDPRAVEFLTGIYEEDLAMLEGLLGVQLAELRRVW